MHVDTTGSFTADPLETERVAVEAEKQGYDGVSVPETAHDAFIALGLAARATSSIRLQSGIAVAFARNPMTLAYQANDVTLLSEGRFDLGIGSQVKPHIERRFNMPWSRPAARMEDFVRAVRAIWSAWETGERLRYEGEFYSHTLMTEFFSPGPNPHGNPPIMLAAVGERMTEVAGRVSDGLLAHSLTTPSYMDEVTVPALTRGRDGGNLDGFQVCLPVFAVLGADEKARAAAEQGVRRQIAFYSSTPPYRPVLEHHGWGELADRLNGLSRQQAWDEMAGLIDDDVLDAFAVAGTPDEVAAGMLSRYGHVVDRISLYTPYEADPQLVLDTTTRLRAA
ncbi:TIGR03617 family F420-dependent LLM class oxidoreductase [Pseudonocardia sp. KRD291]|uniref:TIGR03617 family F420-dependent LLM class oxidoreductase n=1 Tax=Pseudonocardia sp. KRD291 TaxID=2792007 RepID=UPI001C49CF16|nr:TIGR03617 family F420-dependent LLM class oxidoreductase [Pseudonocardia sp. KRD291]MBW0105110.1 TIGR03617 family F420-dependent LLM class oxidoreductase [Pseudonocardia sp. KRD291]